MNCLSESCNSLLYPPFNPQCYWMLWLCRGWLHFICLYAKLWLRYCDDCISLLLAMSTFQDCKLVQTSHRSILMIIAYLPNALHCPNTLKFPDISLISVKFPNTFRFSWQWPPCMSSVSMRWHIKKCNMLTVNLEHCSEGWSTVRHDHCSDMKCYKVPRFYGTPCIMANQFHNCRLLQCLLAPRSGIKIGCNSPPGLRFPSTLGFFFPLGGGGVLLIIVCSVN